MCIFTHVCMYAYLTLIYCTSNVHYDTIAIDASLEKTPEVNAGITQTRLEVTRVRDPFPADSSAEQ